MQQTKKKLDETKLEAGLNASLELQRRKPWKLEQNTSTGFEAGLERLKAMEIGAKQHDKEAPMKSTDVVLAVLYWGGPPLGVQNLYTCPTPKTGIKQIEQFNMSPGLRKKAQDAQDAALRFLTFSSFSRADKAFEIFEVFEVFSLLCNLQDEPRF